ncbi:glycoside hydrolase family 32 protein [Peribacillus muralis]|uniref:glycoside hydrolase family 32 protein n=1 Tax=Peribacillus muralis TaxID=264697 RepID=UPI0038040740
MQAKLDYETGMFSYGDFRLLDYGFDFYAPQTIQDFQGRRIMIAWMAMWESEMPEQKNNWAGAMTIPRELTIQDNKILSNPILEIKKLRENAVQYKNITVEGEHTFNQISGDIYELEVIIDAQASLTFGVKVRRSEALNQETLLMHNRAESLLELNRNRSGSGPKGSRVVPVKLHDNKLCLRIFIDKSSIEVFINNGEKVMSARIYPDQTANGISFFSEKEITLINFQKWDLNKSISNGSIEGNSSS